MKKVAIILSGSGSNDGSEIREALFSMLSLAQQGFKYECFAPNVNQSYVYNHYKNEISKGEERNILVESARLARGRVKDLSLLNPEDFEGLVLPGGYGVGMNLSNFLFVKSENFTIEPTFEKIILAFHQAKKPICFLCASNVIAAKLIPQIQITLGNEGEISKIISEKFNAKVTHVSENIPILDEKNKTVSIPCYLVNVSIVQLYEGINEGIKKFTSML